MADLEKILQEAKNGNLKKWVEFLLRWEMGEYSSNSFPHDRNSSRGIKFYEKYLRKSEYEYSISKHNDQSKALRGIILLRLMHKIDQDVKNDIKSKNLRYLVMGTIKVRAEKERLCKKGAEIGDLNCISYAYNYYRKKHSSYHYPEKEFENLFLTEANDLINNFRIKRYRFEDDLLVDNYLLMRRLRVVSENLFILGKFDLWCAISPRNEFDLSKKIEKIRQNYSSEINADLPDTEKEIRYFCDKYSYKDKHPKKYESWPRNCKYVASDWYS